MQQSTTARGFSNSAAPNNTGAELWNYPDDKLRRILCHVPKRHARAIAIAQGSAVLASQLTRLGFSADALGFDETPTELMERYGGKIDAVFLWFVPKHKEDWEGYLRAVKVSVPTIVIRLYVFDETRTRDERARRYAVPRLKFDALINTLFECRLIMEYQAVESVSGLYLATFVLS